MNADIIAGVGDMTLRLPGSVGVRVDVEEATGKVNISKLTKDGEAYVNDAYGVSEEMLRINIKAASGR